MMRQQPVPNQPVYTWQPTFSVISLRGSVHGESGLIPGYGKVLAGTQQICNIAVVYKGIRKASRFYAHGFHLPVGTIAGSTRFRFPILVRIWNHIMTGINVVARIETYAGYTNIHATASHSTGEMNQTFLHIGGIEKDDWIKLCFTATGITRVLYTMYNCIEVPGKKILLYVSEIGQLSGKVIRTCVSTSQKLGRRLHISTWVHQVQDLKFKLVTRIANGKLSRTLKSIAHLVWPEIKHFAKAKAEIEVPEKQMTGKLAFRTVQTSVEGTFRLKVDLLGLHLKKIMSYIRYGLKLRKMEQRLDVHADATSYQTTIGGSITTEVQQSSTKMSLILNIRNWVTSRFQMLCRTGYKKVSSIFQFVTRKGYKESTLAIDTSNMLIERKLDLLAKLEGFTGKLMLLAHVEEVRDQLLELQVYLISILGETSLKFMPQALPQVRKLNVMISVCETWVLSYLSFIPTEAYKGVEVHISTCSHLVRRVIQWYLTGGRISNQGYGNEIIFDLGKVDPQGPIPPVPTQKWEGGYVEDPFKGVGYVPADDTTGYASPKVDKWLGNVKMYWDDASQPFEGGK